MFCYFYDLLLSKATVRLHKIFCIHKCSWVNIKKGKMDQNRASLSQRIQGPFPAREDGWGWLSLEFSFRKCLPGGRSDRPKPLWHHIYLLKYTLSFLCGSRQLTDPKWKHTNHSKTPDNTLTSVPAAYTPLETLANKMSLPSLLTTSRDVAPPASSGTLVDRVGIAMEMVRATIEALRRESASRWKAEGYCWCMGKGEPVDI